MTLAAGIVARADFSYSSTRKAASGAAEQTIKHYIKGQKMKDDHGDTATVIDFDAQTITSINQSQKTYSVKKFSDLGDAHAPSDVDIKVDVKKTGEVKTIAGFKANEVVFTMDVDNPQSQKAGRKILVEMDLWISKDVPGSSEMRAFYEKNGSRFPWSALMGSGNPGMQKAMVALQRQIASLDGVPVMQVIKVKAGGSSAEAAVMQQRMAQARERLEDMIKQGGPQADAAKQALARMGSASPGSGNLFETTMEFEGFSTAAIPDAVFAVPAGYQKADK